MSKVFAVIVTYNGMQHHWIEKCLKSLEQSTMPVTAIVIDNNSTDNTCEYVPTFFPNAIWFPQEKNLGFGQANNIGIRYALDNDADYILLLNQDATLHPMALKHLIDACDGESLLSPVHLNGDGTRLDEMFSFSVHKAGGTIVDDILTNKPLAQSYAVGEICAACWLLPANVVRKIGGFNPLFYHYGEDNNYYQRLVFHNVKTLLVPAATMCHDRQLYGNIEAYKNKLLHRDILFITADINLSVTKILFFLARKLIRLYTTERKQYRIGGFTKEMLWTIGHIVTIRKSRDKDRMAGSSSWI